MTNMDNALDHGNKEVSGSTGTTASQMAHADAFKMRMSSCQY
jgi:hypothetical protein